MDTSVHVFASLNELYKNWRVASYTSTTYDLTVSILYRTTFTIELVPTVTYRDLFGTYIHFDSQILSVEEIAISSKNKKKHRLIKSVAINNEYGYIYFHGPRSVERHTTRSLHLEFTIYARDIGESAIVFPYPVELLTHQDLALSLGV